MTSLDILIYAGLTWCLAAPIIVGIGIQIDELRATRASHEALMGKAFPLNSRPVEKRAGDFLGERK